MPGACYKPATASALPIATLFAQDALNNTGYTKETRSFGIATPIPINVSIGAPFGWQC